MELSDLHKKWFKNWINGHRLSKSLDLSNYIWTSQIKHAELLESRGCAWPPALQATLKEDGPWSYHVTILRRMVVSKSKSVEFWCRFGHFHFGVTKHFFIKSRSWDNNFLFWRKNVHAKSRGHPMIFSKFCTFFVTHHVCCSARVGSSNDVKSSWD